MRVDRNNNIQHETPLRTIRDKLPIKTLATSVVTPNSGEEYDLCNV